MNKFFSFIRAHKKTALICLILALVLIWYFYPVTLLTNSEAEKTAYICLKNGNNGKEVYLAGADEMGYILDCFQGRKFHRLDPALGMGMSYFFEFYDIKGNLLCEIRMRSPTNLKQGGWFHTPVGDTADYYALESYCDELTDWHPIIEPVS